MVQTESATMALVFADDPTDPPRVHEHRGLVSVGKDWLRLHFPKAWSQFCAARMLGKPLTITFAEWEECCTVTLEEQGHGASNQEIATRLIERLYKVVP